MVRPAEELIPLLTENPAKLLGMDGQRGFIRQGLFADFVVLDENDGVEETYVQGRRVF